MVAALLDPARELLDRGRGRVVLDRRRLRDRVRLDLEHAGAAAEHLLDDGLLARVVEPPTWSVVVCSASARPTLVVGGVGVLTHGGILPSAV